MTFPLNIITGLPVAETHFKFKYGFSFLRKPYPEIVFEAPHRLDPGNELPVLLIIKDADLFPVFLESAEIVIKSPEREIFRKTYSINEKHSSHLHCLCFYAPVPEDFRGACSIICCARIKDNKGKKKTIITDNLPGLSHAPLSCLISEYKRPVLKNWVVGDAHIHTSRTDDQVEFGLPLKETAILSKASGLDWFTAADHSYEFDERSQFNRNTGLYSGLLKEIGEFNRSATDFSIIPGLEISCGNIKGRNIHLLAIDGKYTPGFGDSGHYLFKTSPDLRIEEAVKKSGGICFAAHPYAETGLAERFFLNRGRWEDNDFKNEISGMQFFTGILDRAFFRGRRKWKELLIRGQRSVILAGSDSHGYFNRCRRMNIPFISLKESAFPVTGAAVTFVRSKNNCGEIINGIKEGRTAVSDGPAASIKVSGTECGGTAPSGRHLELSMKVLSTPEFGPVENISVYRGGNGYEEKLLSINPEKSVYEFEGAFPLEGSGKAGYIRSEATTVKHNKKHLCMTGPVYLAKKEKM
ncbi:MAG: CehA/McbA family metallohydrolase [Fibrobacterota bacterium]